MRVQGAAFALPIDNIEGANTRAAGSNAGAAIKTGTPHWKCTTASLIESGQTMPHFLRVLLLFWFYLFSRHHTPGHNAWRKPRALAALQHRVMAICLLGMHAAGTIGARRIFRRTHREYST
jgi:hypothetical protein